jgi:anti-sigma regulatory factor (Ser/Thr protein kinase)
MEPTPVPESARCNPPRSALLPWPRTATERLELSLDGGEEAAPKARRALGELSDELGPDLLERAQLLVTELVANSVRHADAEQVGLRVLVGNGSVWMEVTDPGQGFLPTPHGFQEDGESGWGLYLVGSLADRWGVVRDENRTRVWFELVRE